jgi:predicted DNA-binding transcriptional regulator AlpA
MPEPAPTEPLLLSARATAAALGVCEKTLWQLRRDGLLPTVHVGRAIRFDRRDILRFIEASKSGGAHE